MYVNVDQDSLERIVNVSYISLGRCSKIYSILCISKNNCIRADELEVVGNSIRILKIPFLTASL